MSIQDEALAGRVRGVLAQDKRLSGLPIMVRAANGEIHLKGRVDTEEQKELAATIVHGVPGIRGVVSDELVVREGGE
ncbi:MAG: BON domain-containing protein [Armatimonadota bacterium]|nr:BON domain-containing protein [Armatimonadota bacterium]